MIDLKEASSISGYSSDYVGALIRQGKLPGKKVCVTTAWITTEEAVLGYLSKNKKGAKSMLRSGSVVDRLISRLSSSVDPFILVERLLYLVILLSIALLIFLIYLFSISSFMANLGI